MSDELHMLKERLHVLNLLYQNAEMNGSPVEEMQKIQQQIANVRDLIRDGNKSVSPELGMN
jgi:hypothetical protein